MATITADRAPYDEDLVSKCLSVSTNNAQDSQSINSTNIPIKQTRATRQSQSSTWKFSRSFSRAVKRKPTEIVAKATSADTMVIMSTPLLVSAILSRLSEALGAVTSEEDDNALADRQTSTESDLR